MFVCARVCKRLYSQTDLSFFVRGDVRQRVWVTVWVLLRTPPSSGRLSCWISCVFCYLCVIRNKTNKSTYMPANRHPCLLWDGFLPKPFTCRTASAALQHVSNISRVFCLFVLCVAVSFWVCCPDFMFLYTCLFNVLNFFGAKKGWLCYFPSVLHSLTPVWEVTTLWETFLHNFPCVTNFPYFLLCRRYFFLCFLF